MKNDLPLDITVDKIKRTVVIRREFAAPLSQVWDAYTKPDILDQWWGPKPLVSKTKAMNFEVGGRRFWAMVNPDGQERWSIQKYTSITPKTNFRFTSNFADKDENAEQPGSEWDISFSERDGRTEVTITIYNESLARMERLTESGFREGVAMQFKNLEELLAASQRI